MPINETINSVADSGTFSVKCPCASETTPIDVPLTNTVAPAIGSSFSADRIRPETFFVCALSMHTPIQRNASNRYNRFLIKIGLGLKIVNNKYKCLSIFRMHLRRAVKPGEARSVLSYALHEHILHLI